MKGQAKLRSKEFKEKYALEFMPRFKSAGQVEKLKNVDEIFKDNKLTVNESLAIERKTQFKYLG